MDLVAATRDHEATEYGGSPRVSIAFQNAAKARAAIDGRDYVIPDDVRRLAEPILVNRLVVNTEAELGDVSRQDVVADVLSSVVPPGGEGVTPERTTRRENGASEEPPGEETDERDDSEDVSPDVANPEEQY